MIRDMNLGMLLAIVIVGTASQAPSEPIPIATIEELQRIGQDAAYPLDAAYVLTQDIDASATASWNDGAGFEPIGNDDTSSLTPKFTGDFDGAGHTIAGLVINRPDENSVALFRCAQGLLHDIALEAPYIRGGSIVSTLVAACEGSMSECHVRNCNVAAWSEAGGLAAECGRSLWEDTGARCFYITGCSATGIVASSNNAGGLAANCGYYNAHGVSGQPNCSYITGCWADCSVQGEYMVGGLFGDIGAIGALSDCHAAGDVAGSYAAGGLAGLVQTHGAPIERCFSSARVSGKIDLGGLIGQVYQTTLIGCFATGAVKGESTTGGLIGLLVGETRYCFATGTVQGNETTGGLIGAQNQSSNTRCFATGWVACTDESAGGLNGFFAAQSSSNTLESFWDTLSTGQTQSEGGSGLATSLMMQQSTYESAGFGFGDDTEENPAWTINNGASYAYLKAFANANALYTLTLTATTGGSVSVEPTATGYTPNALVYISATPAEGYTFAGWTGDAVGNDSFPLQQSPLPVTMTDSKTIRANFVKPIEINSIQELQRIGNDPGYPLFGDYLLAHDLDASATASWNNGAGFEPIAPSRNRYFTGTFDGQGFTIAGLTINRPADSTTGLFGCVADSASIANLTLCGANITGSNYTGALAGYCLNGSLTNCAVSGVVNGRYYVGGLAGQASSPGIVENCHANVAVTGVWYVGGLLGWLGAMINDLDVAGCQRCIVQGSVKGVAEVGGLSGYATPSVIECAASCDIETDTSGGGLVATSEHLLSKCRASGTITSHATENSANNPYCANLIIGGLAGMANGTISDCYATGTLTAQYTNAGLVGYNNAILTNCFAAVQPANTDDYALTGSYTCDVCTGLFWDTQLSGIATSITGTGLTTAELKHEQPFLESGWDFESTWAIDENESYPYLQWEKEVAPMIGTECEVNDPTQEGEQEGSTEGSAEGDTEGSIEGDTEGSIEGDTEGSITGSIEGDIEGQTVGEAQYDNNKFFICASGNDSRQGIAGDLACLTLVSLGILLVRARKRLS